MNDYLFVPGGVAFAAGGVAGMADWAGGRLENNGVCSNPLPPDGAAEGDEVGALAGAWDCFNNASLSASALDFWCWLEATMAMMMARPKNMPAAIFGDFGQDVAGACAKQGVGRAAAKGQPGPGILLGQLQQHQEDQNDTIHKHQEGQKDIKHTHSFPVKSSF